MRILSTMIVLVALAAICNAASVLVYDNGNGITTLMGMTGIAYDVVNSTSIMGMTTAQFKSYEVIITGWSTGYSGLINNTAWKAAIDGRVMLSGQDPDCHQTSGGVTLVKNAINWAIAGAGTGFIALGDYQTAWNWTPWMTGVTTTVNHGEDVNIVSAYASHPIHTGLTSALLSNWGNSYHINFNTLPTGFNAIDVTNTGLAVNIIREATTVVPEPATLGLLAFGLLIFCLKRK